MKAYPNYKDSGVPWLGEVPEHWETIKTKYLFSERIQKGYPDEPLLAATQIKGVVPKSMYENRTVEAQVNLHLLKLVEPDDFVISLRSFQGGIEYAYYRGIISPAYTILTPNKRIFPLFYRHLAKSKKYISLLQTCVTGIREGQNIDYRILRETPLPIPSFLEQQQIAHYLDWQTAKINKFVNAKKKLIALLKEQKQIIINEAVTKGLNPDVEMKDSGVEWLGDIPAHWEVRKLKYIASMKSGDNLTSMEINKQGQYPVYGGNGLRGYYHSYNRSGEFLLIGRQGALCGNVHQVKGNFWVTEHAVVATLRKRICIHWYYYMLVFMNLNQYSEAAAQPGLSVEKIQNLITTVPSLNEQEQIAKFLDTETTLIDKTITRAEREIELIQEYRTRLVSDVVTGKVDVRSVAVPDFEAVEEEIDTQDDAVSEDELIMEDSEE